MSIIKLVGGVIPTWTACMTAELNSLPNNDAIIAASAIAQSTNEDLEAEFSIACAAYSPTGGFFTVAIYALNGDGSTYGDGRFASFAAGPPATNCYAAYSQVQAGSSTTVTGNFGVPYQGGRVLLPQGNFKPVLYNSTGTTLASSGNTLYIRTTNRSVA